MRRMSFAMTVEQLLDGTKTVTRRSGGWKAKPYGHRMLRAGDRFLAIDRLDFRQKNGSRVLGVCTAVSVRREPLCAITDEDPGREGFPDMSAADFVAIYCIRMKCEPGIEVTRIGFTFEAGPAQSVT